MTKQIKESQNRRKLSTRERRMQKSDAGNAISGTLVLKKINLRSYGSCLGVFTSYPSLYHNFTIHLQLSQLVTSHPHITQKYQSHPNFVKTSLSFEIYNLAKFVLLVYIWQYYKQSKNKLLPIYPTKAQFYYHFIILRPKLIPKTHTLKLPNPMTRSISLLPRSNKNKNPPLNCDAPKISKTTIVTVSPLSTLLPRFPLNSPHLMVLLEPSDNVSEGVILLDRQAGKIEACDWLR